jgi:hypothetical protein
MPAQMLRRTEKSLAPTRPQFIPIFSLKISMGGTPWEITDDVKVNCQEIGSIFLE